jgi:tripartite-type tricarboxylate transporter receptor subunit TctC
MDNFHLNRRQASVFISGCLGGGLATTKVLAAEEFPSKPVTLVVTFAPGATADLWARLVGPKLSELWKVPVIVENKPGAGTVIGMTAVARAKPDGHTLLLGSLSTAMAKLTNANIPFDPQVDLLPVCKYLSFKIVFATNPATYAKAKNLQDLVALSKTTSNGIFFGGTGPGTAFNMSAGFILKGLGMNYSEVNYNGMNPIMLAAIRNDIQLFSNTPAALKAHFDSGQLVPLSAHSEERFPELPNVQTVREAGYKGFFPILWNAIYAPKGTPRQVLEKIAADIMAVSMSPDMKERIEGGFSGFIPKSNPDSFARELVAETKQWQDYLASINFKPQ